MIRLTKNQILMLHSQLIIEMGGSDGVRDENFRIAELDYRTSKVNTKSN